MNEDKNNNNAKRGGQTPPPYHQQPGPAPMPPQPMYRPAPKPQYGPVVKAVRTATAGVLIACVAVFAFISILAIWMFKDDSAGIWWRSAVSVFTIGMASLIVFAVAPLLDKSK